MEKRKLLLETAVDIREKLDREIHEDYQLLVSQNSVSKKKKNTVDVRELLRMVDLKEKQVIILKEEIQRVNLKQHPREKNSNSYYIYRLSQLKIRKDNLHKMSTDSNGTFVAEIKAKESATMLRNTLEEIDKVTQKLSKFNTLKKNEIKVQFEEDLLYLLK